MAVDDPHAVFALLDDCNSTAVRRSSRLYTGFRHERVCTSSAQLDAVCEAAADDARRGLHAVVIADYEFGRNLVLTKTTQRAGVHGGVNSETPGALRFLLFDQCVKLSRDEVDAWLVQRDSGAVEPSVAGTGGVRASVDYPEFERAIGAIHDALRAGDSYQVNYTYRLGFDVFGPPAALFRRLRARQTVQYGALVAMPGGRWVLSCSPELFIEKKSGALRARPMKGTAPRSRDPDADRAAADFLAHDPKNRAENVMIVDLLRNDLSRVAETGSVKVPALFSVEPYESVLQMTSTVTALLRPRTSFADILRALFPCGSITGAPKHQTMQLIDVLESTPRGLYTGAIGWLDAPAQPMAPATQRCGDFCLSVAIRTLTLDPSPRQNSIYHGTLGIGAGIVLDSVAADEYAECQLKARFLTEADPGFQLFETMYATREAGVRHIDRHLARIGASAAWLGFRFDEAAVRARLDAHCAALQAGQPHRMRLVLDKAGAVEVTVAPLMPLAEESVGVLLGPAHGFANVQSDDPLLHHKTTRRAEYDRGWREAEAMDAFDTLFFNERGELTEGGRSNVFVKLEGKWWTPPLACGVLPGVMRAVLLDDVDMAAAERVLTRDDVIGADALLICNALRGAVPARIVG
ncbi:bifunctional anthranilate synthase component I family protein/class IV aminotransferase [Paraburkholderia edwinii]|uniref:Bifunctional anthranilate synthase component I family protein/class IV aminotransferase n=1 Tax=Paraburkholderia edwinii TaxID=2861782 RepID=A0ABX8URY4_9BURK|nr:bifunctional anthranilate synthase component I family protein/class IV aminotransferase [Paraburkholderia edwinii]QYD69683.1 bifunctional anthranilate synthase component I family protein/class IV aminotransferase [Paraburkholderia edwinii]